MRRSKVTLAIRGGVKSPFRRRPVRLLKATVETEEKCPLIVEPSGTARAVPTYTSSTNLAVIGSPAFVMRRPFSSLQRRSLPEPTTIVLGEGCNCCAAAINTDAVKTEKEISIPVTWDFIIHLMWFWKKQSWVGLERLHPNSVVLKLEVSPMQ